jgi:catechol 2,3-dioxygenase-like lactoylglutathione lyase family enzyme
MTPRLTGILETALDVDDLERAVAFYKTVFEFEVLQRDDHFCAFNVLNRQVLLLFLRRASAQPTMMAGGVIPPHDSQGTAHLAFSIPAGSGGDWERWLADREVRVESKVHWPRGGRSLYFRDPDGHLVELATPGVWTVY